MGRQREIILRWFFITILIASIEVIVRLDLVSKIFIASPSSIAVVALQKILSGELIELIIRTMYEVAVTFVISAIVGLIVGYQLWKHPVLGRAYDELLGALFASPLILLYPIFFVIFGRGINAIIAMGVLYGIIPIILNTHQALREVNSIFIKVGKSMNLTERQIMRHILLPAASPIIIGGLKLGLTYILISTIAVEFLVEIGGIGMLASKGYFWFNTEELYIGVVSAIILSMIFLYLLGKAETRLFTS